MTGVYSATVRSPTGIAADPPLTSHGTRQADELARHLLSLDPPIDTVYSSPYYRCLQTITPFANLKNAKILPEKGISEWFGSAPFDHPQPAPTEVLKPMFPAYCVDYVSAQTPSRKGETLPQLYERIAATVRDIVERCDAEGKRAIVLCTHAAVVIALGRILTGNVPESPDVDDFQAFTCGLSVYYRKGASGSSNLADEKLVPSATGLGMDLPPCLYSTAMDAPLTINCTHRLGRLDLRAQW